MKVNALVQWPPFHPLNTSCYFLLWSPCTHWPLYAMLVWWPSIFLSLRSWPRCHLFREAFRNHSYFLNTSLSRWPYCTVSRPHSILTICSDILVWLLAKHLAPSLGYEPHMGRNQTDLFIKVCGVPGTAWHMECEIKLCGMNKWNEWVNEWKAYGRTNLD